MAEIPYFFDTPIPKYFRETGWFGTPNSVLFLTWAFSKCSIEKRIVVHDCKEITLQPYEFITGRGKSSADSLLTEDAFRHQLKSFINAGLLKKTPNSTPNRFTCYVWVTERFSKPNPQLNTQLTPNSPPTEHPQSRRKKRISKESHPPTPSGSGDGMSDDFSSNNEKEEEKTEVYQGIFLTKPELDACVKIKGDIEKVKHAIEYIQTSKRRKHDISDWPNALAKWKIENKLQTRVEDNIAYAEKLCKTYENFTKTCFWRCYMYNDRKKDQRGILFEPESSYQECVFVALIDGDFQQRCKSILKEKKMEKG